MFPKYLYVKVEEDGDDEYFVATAAPLGHAELDANVEVAKYVRLEIGAVTTRAEYTSPLEILKK